MNCAPDDSTFPFLRPAGLPSWTFTPLDRTSREARRGGLL